MSRNRVEEPEKKKRSRAEKILGTKKLPEYSNCVVFLFIAPHRLGGEQQYYGIIRCLHLTLTLTMEVALHSET
jgi:hypothetical protein